MRDKILIVDDVEINREILTEILADKYDILKAENGIQAMQLLEKHHEQIAVLMLDIVMLKMDVFELLRKLNLCLWSKNIGIIIISGDDNIQTENDCFELGASDFVHRPFNNQLVQKRVDNIVSLFRCREELEYKVEQQTEALQGQYRKLLLQANQLRQNKESVIEFLGTIVEYRNLESGRHIGRVKDYTKILAKQIQKNIPSLDLPRKI